MEQNPTGFHDTTEEEVKTKLDDSEMVELLREIMSKELVKGEIKMSMSDMIRLMQWHKEMGGEKPKGIEVRWVEERTGEKAD